MRGSDVVVMDPMWSSRLERLGARGMIVGVALRYDLISSSEKIQNRE